MKDCSLFSMAQELPIMIPDPHSLVAMGRFGGLSSPPHLRKLQQYKTVAFLSNFHNVELPCTNEKPFYWLLSLHGSGPTVCKFLTAKNRDSATATCVYSTQTIRLCQNLLPKRKECVKLRNDWDIRSNIKLSETERFFYSVFKTLTQNKKCINV